MSDAIEPVALLAHLAHPNRLPILIALEERPRSASELAADLDLDPEQVRWALRKLQAAELVDVIDRQPNTFNLVSAIYGARHRRWKGVLKALAAVGRSPQR
jgi:DNA-binding transcriptional ArsR family regulator